MALDRYSDDHTIEVVRGTQTVNIKDNLSVEEDISAQTITVSDGFYGDVTPDGTSVGTKFASWTGSFLIGFDVPSVRHFGFIPVDSTGDGPDLSLKTILSFNILINDGGSSWWPQNSESSTTPYDAFLGQFLSIPSIIIMFKSGPSYTVGNTISYRITVTYN